MTNWGKFLLQFTTFAHCSSFSGKKKESWIPLEVGNRATTWFLKCNKFDILFFSSFYYSAAQWYKYHKERNSKLYVRVHIWKYVFLQITLNPHRPSLNDFFVIKMNLLQGHFHVCQYFCWSSCAEKCDNPMIHNYSLQAICA